jgi:Ankyrin repeats (3 copies)/Ankyrin repeat
MSTVKTEKNTNAATEALWRIAETNDTREVESVLADGADINASNAHGMTALMRAASNGQVRMVRVLLKHGADPNVSRNDKFTPLMLAAFFGHEEVVRVLVEYGADTAAATRFGTSAQMWAACQTFDDVVHYLDKPRTVQRLSKEPAVEHPRSQAQKVPSASDDDISNLPTPAVALERSIMKDSRVLEAEPSTLASEIKTPKELPEDQEALQRFAQRPRFTPRFQPTNRRMVVYSWTTLLLVVAVIAGLTWRRQRNLNAIGSQTHPTVAVATTTSAAKNLGEAKTIALSDAQVGTLAQGNDANDVSSHYERAENVTRQNRSRQPVATRIVVSPSDSRRGKPSEEQNRVVNVKEQGPVPTDGPEDVHNREVPSAVASTAKPQPGASRVVTPRNAPAPLPTQLLSPSKSSASKGRTIQWP